MPAERVNLEKIRRAVADYLASEGCSCCQGESHSDDYIALARALQVPLKDDWYSFVEYRTPKK